MTNPKTAQDSQNRKTTFNTMQDDPGFLVAKGRFNAIGPDEEKKAQKDHQKKLASAIYMAMQNHGYAKVRAIGRNATYNAVIAINIASGHCKQQGIELCWESSFNEGNLGEMRDPSHVQDVTAIIFDLKNWNEVVKEANVRAEEELSRNAR